MEKDTSRTCRHRFFINLRAGETSVISWKKLVNKTVVTPQAQAQACIDDSKLQKGDLPPPCNRFSAVIERIEHLYKGDSSSDEEKLDDVPDDDQYDTEDSFIDDEELDEYFSVDKSKTKHSGFFINRGKLEKVNEPATLPVHAPKKSKKKYIKKIPVDRCIEGMPEKLLKVGSVRMKAAARSVPLARLNGANSGWDRALFAGVENLVHKHNYDRDVEVIQSQGSTFGFGPCKTDKYKGSINKEEASHKNAAKNSAVKDERKPKSMLVRSKDSLVKGGKLLEFKDSMNSARSEKNIYLKVDSQTRKSNKDASEMTTSSQYKITEKAGKGVDLRDANSLGNKLLPSKIRNLKEMIELGKSTKEGKKKLQDIRREGTKLVKTQLKSKVPERPEGSLDDFQSVSISAMKGSSSVPYKRDNATEGFLCELHDQYLEGMDRNKGPQIKKLYVEDVEKAKKKKDSLKNGWNEDWNVANGSNVNFKTIVPYDKQIELERTHSISVLAGSNLQCKVAKVKLPSITDEKRKYVKKSSRKEFKNNNRQPLYIRKK